MFKIGIRIKKLAYLHVVSTMPRWNKLWKRGSLNKQTKGYILARILTTRFYPCNVLTFTFMQCARRVPSCAMPTYNSFPEHVRLQIGECVVLETLPDVWLSQCNRSHSVLVHFVLTLSTTDCYSKSFLHISMTTYNIWCWKAISKSTLLLTNARQFLSLIFQTPNKPVV
jgi:hypothetical protein